MRRQDFDFELPEALIAQSPSPERSSSRLLHVHGNRCADRQVRDLPGLLRQGDLLIFNDTRVIKARLFGRKPSGGRVEILVERILSPTLCLAQLGVSRTPADGGRIELDCDGQQIELVDRAEGLFRLRLLDDTQNWLELLQRSGRLPLPPYIQHAPGSEDEARYQTLFADKPGAVAAPTAGLHFDQTLLEALGTAGIDMGRLTLHVGAGTFQPVRVDQLSEHRMHSERYCIDAQLIEQIATTRARGGRVCAVGTTVTRALEASAAVHGQPVAGEAESRLFITPGFEFRVVDLMLTNFHLPQSTLLMMVCAFAGHQTMLAAYRHAVAARYRFFSYGDAMLIEPLPH